MELNLTRLSSWEPGKTYPGPVMRKEENRYVVEEDGRRSWEVDVNKDRTEFTAWQPEGCESGSHQVWVGPKGVTYESTAGGMVPMSEGKTEIAMTLSPEQYEWAGLNVVSTLIGQPISLLAGA